MSANNGYIGRAPSDSSVVIAREKFTPSGVTTDFTFAANYDIGYLDAYLNGVRLIDGSDYTASDGRNVGLTSAAQNGDILELIAYKAFTVSNVSASTGDFVVGDQLTVSGLSTLANVYSTGIITATSFEGDGSNLTGVSAGKWASNDTGINTTTSVGIGTTNAGGAAHSANSQVLVVGIVTANSLYGALTGNVTGDVTGDVSGSSGSCTGNAAGLTGTPSITVQDVTAEYVSIGGTLTYDDVINVDSVGIVTAGQGVRVTKGGIDIIGITTGLSISGVTTGLSVSGIATFVGLTTFNDGLSVYSGLTTAGAGLTVSGDALFSATTGTGTTIGLGGINVSGVVTATSFAGDGSSLTGLSAGISLQQAGSWVSSGTAATTFNFASGATLTNVDSGISTITISAGINTVAFTTSNVVYDLALGSYQDHKATVSGVTTFSCTGGTEGESHTLRIVNSGVTTVGFSTYFLWPSGAMPSIPTTDGTISLISFTVHREGAVGLGTQLLAGSSLDFS